MKIYCTRRYNLPIDKYIGKDVWVKGSLIDTSEGYPKLAEFYIRILGKEDNCYLYNAVACDVLDFPPMFDFTKEDLLLSMEYITKGAPIYLGDRADTMTSEELVALYERNARL